MGVRVEFIVIAYIDNLKTKEEIEGYLCEALQKMADLRRPKVEYVAYSEKTEEI